MTFYKACCQILLLLVATLSAHGATEAWGRPVWSDEFEGASLSRTNWTFDVGGDGWGNNELEYYTDRPENACVTNGCLVIEARREIFKNRSITSARLKTKDLHEWTYGRIEARMQLPSGKGVWPAFWMLGAKFPRPTGWPECGEIDIMEHVDSLGPTTVRGSAHGPGYSGGDSHHGDGEVADLIGKFHTFAIEWEPGVIRWFVDENNYYTLQAKEARGKWVFDQPFFILLNLAIGGNWPGSPDASTPFPVRMLVDYVRVYQRPVAAKPQP